ncbi:MAG: DUF4199 domain-containing protein [Ferruginibacter sp.]|nr:DUF4199 domain-containing protein [Ferruginibacter sp.]
MKISAAYKGIITGVLMIATALVAYLILKLPVNQKEQYALYGIFTLGIVWSLVSEKNNANVVSFKDFFGVGFRTFMMATLLMVIFTFIYFKFDTSYRDLGIEENKVLLLKEGNHTADEIDKNAVQLKKIFLPMMVGGAVFKYLILGALVSLVGAGFLSQQKTKD